MLYAVLAVVLAVVHSLGGSHQSERQPLLPHDTTQEGSSDSGGTQKGGPGAGEF